MPKVYHNNVIITVKCGAQENGIYYHEKVRQSFHSRTIKRIEEISDPRELSLHSALRNGTHVIYNDGKESFIDYDYDEFVTLLEGARRKRY